MNKSIIDAARAEVEKEKFRDAVNAEKRKLLAKWSLWNRLFPFVIKIERKKNV